MCLSVCPGSDYCSSLYSHLIQIILFLSADYPDCCIVSGVYIAQLVPHCTSESESAFLPSRFTHKIFMSID